MSIIAKKKECEFLINTTHTCNLSCKYCFVEEGYNTFSGKGASNAITDITISELINFAVKYCEEYDKVTFHFYGGEPLLLFDKVKEITEKAYNTFKNLRATALFFITTNGTLINDEIANFFNLYKYKVLISFDGEDYTHNSMRVFHNGEGSHNTVLNNIRFLKNYTNITIGLSAVIHNQNRLLTTYNYLKSFSPAFIKAEYIRTPEGSPFELKGNSKELYFKDLEKIADEVVDDLLNDRVPIDYRFNSRVLQIWRQIEREEFCSAGCHILGIAANGDIFPCTLLIGDKSSFLGDVKNGLDDSKRDKFISWHKYTGKQSCQICEERIYCGGGCSAMWKNTNQGFCDFIKHEIKLAKYIYNRVAKEKPEALALLVSKEFHSKLTSLIDYDLQNENL